MKLYWVASLVPLSSLVVYSQTKKAFITKRRVKENKRNIIFINKSKIVTLEKDDQLIVLFLNINVHDEEIKYY